MALIALLICLAILAGIWWIKATAPMVNPDKCIFDDIRNGANECGGCCRPGKTQPCEEG